MITRNEKETIELGKKLGSLLEKGTTVALKGDLAGGKTTFTKGIGEALNIRQVINSPTFTILKIYHGDLPLYHIDAYRLEGNDYDLGISEYEEEGIMVVEWPEYYAQQLPEDYIEVLFTYIDDDSRQIDFICHGEKYKKIIEEMEMTC
ncbi:MAG: tRNA (adenosine(37)-N6)-threonylcarbamoyltransferase complex ATPase subunit type 1 TsaE [Erysipelotrichaceae bacterium]|nr:tRNA (adenosine(37)-N6)-threonylcarbamoyltransferase complex ATPase subunit type 1 TsaE [Erysipelotrichaceae bacterium]